LDLQNLQNRVKPGRIEQCSLGDRGHQGIQ